MKAINSTRFYAIAPQFNNKAVKMAVLSTDENKHYLLSSRNNLNDGSREELAAAGINCLGMYYGIAIESPDEAGITALIPGAEIHWAGSDKYNELAEAAKGSRPAKKADPAPAPATPAPAVVSANDFVCPKFEDAPDAAEVIKIVPMQKEINAYGIALATALLSNTTAPAHPESIEPFMALPAFAAAVDNYTVTIISAVEKYRKEQIEKEEAAKKEAEAREAQKRAAEAGKQTIKLSTGRVLEIDGTPHKCFKHVAELVERRENVYLYGPAGTGKTYLCEQIARAFNLPFYRNGKTEDIYNSYTGGHVAGAWPCKNALRTCFYRRRHIFAR